MPVYALVVAKNGPKQKLHPAGSRELKPSEQLGGGSAVFTDGSMAGFAARLSMQLGRPVIDRTDLKGGYNFTLEWTPASGEGSAEAIGLPPQAEPQPPGESNGPSIFTALQDRLGLKLEPQKGPVDILIIDHPPRMRAVGVERPSEN